MNKFRVVFCFLLLGMAVNAQLLNGYGIKIGMGETNHRGQYTENFEFNLIIFR